ncbi:ABC transporter ATP-binding protein [Peijinzhouia sedimentorum]
MHTLSVENISKRYGRELVLDSISFAVEPGTVLGVVGPNGSGKSTLFGIILGLRESDSGNVQLFGDSNIQNNKHRIGVAMDQGSFYTGFSAKKNLQLSAIVKGLPDVDIDAALQQVELGHTGSKSYKKFSYGMKKRLEIADAMLSNPDLYILDEPTNGLDPEGIVFVRELVKRLQAAGKTVIISSHYLQEIEKICTDILMLRKGKMLFYGKATELREKHGDLEEFFLTNKN